MQERRKLRSLELLGGRALIRTILFVALVALAAIAALGYVLPAHHLSEAGFHSNFHDGGPLSLLVLIGAGGCVVALKRWRRLGSGMAAGVIAMGAAILALIPVLLVHMFQHVDDTYGEAVFAIGELGLFFVGAAIVLVEPFLYITQRRSLERDDPEFPVARVLA